MSLGANATNPAVYGVNTQALILNGGEVVEIIVNNDDTGKHPIHLHGHNFQVVARSDDNYGNYNGTDITPAIPMKRDVIMVKPLGYFRIRFIADNPGVWLLHCHIEW
jgi:iron transport multicopper oxidase